MADEEHLKRLVEQGVEAWNAWRRDNPAVQPPSCRGRCMLTPADAV
jgi:hypothetical protein